MKMSEEKNKTPTITVPIITKIQQELKVPKTVWNKFGQFYYRTAESIETAVKPLLKKYGAQLYFDEKMIEVGGRVYVEEICHYKDPEQEITISGHAREDASKKSMDGSQLTGSSSSYATKYCLTKLFLIDDTKDADGYDNRQSSKPRKPAISDQELINATVTLDGKPVKMTELVKEAVNARQHGTANADPASNYLHNLKKGTKEWAYSRLIAERKLF